MNTLETLKEQIVETMSQGQWLGTSSLHTNNVKILLTELAAVIKDMKTHQQPDEVNKLAVKVATWVVNEVINRPVFDALNGLQGTFASLIDDDLIGAGSGVEYCKDMVNLIESLARASVSQPKSMASEALGKHQGHTHIATASLNNICARSRHSIW